MGQVPDIVVATDELGLVVYLNEAAERVLGYSSKEIVGSFVVEFYSSLEEAKRVMAAIRDPRDGGPGRLGNFRTTYRNKQGDDIPVVMSGAILHDEDGAPAGTIRIGRTV